MKQIVLVIFLAMSAAILTSATSYASPVVSVTSAPTVDYDSVAGNFIDSTTHKVKLPSTVVPGDMLIAIITIDGNATITPPAGWASLWSTNPNSSSTATAFYRIVTSKNESQKTATFSTNITEQGTAQVYKVGNWSGSASDIVISTPVINTESAPGGTTANPPALTVPWSGRTLWIATAQTSTSRTPISGPNNGYSELYFSTSSSTTAGAQISSAYKFGENQTEDPGTFTFSSTGVNSTSYTIGLKANDAPPSNKLLQHFSINRDNKELFVPMYTNKPFDVPDSSVRRVVFLNHGSSANIEDYFDYIQSSIGGTEGILIVTPQFAESKHQPADNQLYWGSGWRQCNRSSSNLPWRISSCEVYDLLYQSTKTTFPSLESVVYIGNSAGAQIVNRYAAARESESNIQTRFVQIAPSSYLYLDEKRVDSLTGQLAVPTTACSTYNDYKYGLSNTSVTSYMHNIGPENLRLNYGANRVLTLVGTLDQDESDPSLDTGCAALAQGAERVERAQNFHKHIGDLFGYSVYTRHQFGFIEGVSHSASSIINSPLGKSGILQGYALVLPFNQQATSSNTIPNGTMATLAQSTVSLSANSAFRDSSPNKQAYMYVELRDDNLFNAPIDPSAAACDSTVTWQDCTSKIWRVATQSDTNGSLEASINISSLPSSDQPYQWQTAFCDYSNICSDWSGYNGQLHTFMLTANFELEVMPDDPVSGSNPDSLASSGDRSRLADSGVNMLISLASGILMLVAGVASLAYFKAK